MTEPSHLDRFDTLIRESQEVRREMRETLEAVEAQMQFIRAVTDLADPSAGRPQRDQRP